MRSRMLVSFVAIAVLATIVPFALFIATDDAEGQEPGPMLLNDMILYLNVGMEMSPLPPEAKDEYQSTIIPNGFIKDGLFGYNLLPIGHTYWQNVGEWMTEPIRETINLGGRAEVNIYATREEGSGAVSSDFIFYIMRGTEPLLQLEAMNQRIEDGVDTRINAVGWFPSNNDTTVEAGTQITLMIRARCNGGAIMKFGSPEVASGFTLGSNSLQIMNLFMDKDKITVEYKDAFMVPWIKLYTQVKIDQVIQANYQMSSEMNTINRTREIIWERESPPDTYEIFISISYHYTGDYNISDTRTLKIVKPYVSDMQAIKNFVNQWILVIIIALLVIVSLVMFSKHRKRVWKRRFRDLPVPIQELSDHKKKKAWKRSYKDIRKTEREKRKIEKEKKEDEEDEEFSLFKRKQKREPRRKPSVSLNLSSDAADELEL